MNGGERGGRGEYQDPKSHIWIWTWLGLQGIQLFQAKSLCVCLLYFFIDPNWDTGTRIDFKFSWFEKRSYTSYDAVSDLMHNWVPQRPDVKSALRVVKMVLNTQCYQYLWLSMWFHAKKSKETLKNSKSLILQCKFGSRAQKWPKIAQKTDH